MTTPTPTFELRGITKRFPGVVANDRVTFTALPGEVHALLGENGAGKSTLMNVLSGLYRPDEGDIYVHGRRVTFQTPRDAIQAGIGMVHQHFMLVPSQTVAENIVLGQRGLPFVPNRARIEADVRRLSEQYGLPIDPRARVWQLSVGEQQRVEILKTLYRGADILILDEPTAVLTPQETEGLFKTLHEMTAAGKSIIFISHKLDEVLAIADRITVLRGGKSVATVANQGMTKPELAQLMVGRAVLFQVEKEATQLGAPSLVLQQVSALDDKKLPALRKLSLTVHAGEIVGVAGVAGNGQRELAEVICGLRPTTSGEVQITSQTLTNAPPLAMIEAGVAYVPEDRSATGSAPNLSIAENLVLKQYRMSTFGRGIFLNRRRMAHHAAHLVKEYAIATPNVVTAARKLSGGNLQKVILAREIGGNPTVLVAAYPTRGLDVGAIENVRRMLLQGRYEGMAILLISEDLDEIFAMSDRIVVLYEGQIMGEVSSEHADRETIGLLMAGTHRQKQPQEGVTA
ncbi:MAG: ABC transporter ATP-binding protein [Caldilineaceae bacterium]|nr:ABC transporter ATP-binding protein [Caldilineaceae bacterium]